MFPAPAGINRHRFRPPGRTTRVPRASGDKPEKEKVEKIVIEEMENAYKLKVPLIADAGWGKNWLEAH